MLTTAGIILGVIVAIVFAFVFSTKYISKSNQGALTEQNQDESVLILTPIPTPPTVLTANLKDCRFESELVTAKLDDLITIENTDDSDHTIKVDNDHIYTISAKQKGYILMNFDNSTGEFPFICDGKDGGVFKIEAEPVNEVQVSDPKNAPY